MHRKIIVRESNNDVCQPMNGYILEKVPFMNATQNSSFVNAMAIYN